MPDLQVLTEAAYAAASDSGLEQGRPEIAIEIVSPRTRAHDRVRKLQWYAAIGVPEHWIVDPRERTLDRLVLRRDEPTYDVVESCEGDTTFRPKNLRGLAIPLRDLWRALPRKRA